MALGIIKGIVQWVLSNPIIKVKKQHIKRLEKELKALKKRNLHYENMFRVAGPMSRAALVAAYLDEGSTADHLKEKAASVGVNSLADANEYLEDLKVPEVMSMGRACELGGALMNASVMGEYSSLLTTVPLKQFLIAMEVLKEHNSTAQFVDGQRNLYVVADDHVVAEIFLKARGYVFVDQVVRHVEAMEEVLDKENLEITFCSDGMATLQEVDGAEVVLQAHSYESLMQVMNQKAAEFDPEVAHG